MNRLFLFAVSLFVSGSLFGQKDSLQLGDPYAEDQLYMLISYNQLFDQPAQIKGSGFSYGLSAGYIKDFTLNKQGTLAIGLGIGYNFDSFNHGLKVTETNNVVSFEVDNTLSSNKLSIHSLEFPLELRWRNSDAQTYNFWRIYAGAKLMYNLANTFRFNDGVQTFTFENVSRFKDWQLGFTLSVGYRAFTIHTFYGLTPILSDSSIGTTKISTKILKIGVIFYFL